MMTNSYDAAYSEAARARQGVSRAEGPPTRSSLGLRRRWVLAPVLVVLGLLTGTAAAQVRRLASAAQGVRPQLVSEVQMRTAQSDALARQAAQLRAQVAAGQKTALQADAAGRALAGQLSALELVTGVDPVAGPGLLVTLDDAANLGGPPGGASPGPAPTGANRVQDRDLQTAVNALWAAGAEAVSINGLRLTAQTAIRSAGEAILVDFRPVAPPYRIRAVGDPNHLATGFADSAGGRLLSTYTSLYGLRLSVAAQQSQTLPGAGTPVLHYAQPVGPTGGPS